jgi:methionyl-tRNA formyltransferase
VRVALFGFQTWGHRVLEHLIGSKHEVVLVVTHPRSDHAYESIWSDSVEELARAKGVSVLVKDRPDSEVAGALSGADVLVACNWRTWIPPEVFTAPRLGTLNVHDSLLPRYAGFAPLNWAIINGEAEVGVTAHVMDERLDRGAIVLQWKVPVGPRDTATDMFHATLEMMGPITLEALGHLEHGTGERIPQDLSQASFFHKRSVEDSVIDWTWPAADIVNLVRAQSDPYPNAYSFAGGRRLRVLSASVSPHRCGGTAGRVFARAADGQGVIIVCGPEAHRGGNPGLVIERVRDDDGREGPARDFFPRLGGYLRPAPGAPDS